ncbi:MAG: capsule assembly Wzi family protein [Bacteroidales bacterium]|nr:capsule assembly Wzi family protein [Bacteroidales bacterium]
MGTIKSLLLFQFNSVGGDDIWDQRISIGYNYLLPKAGIEIYSELGFNDNPAPDLDGYVRNFSHTMVFLGGLKKFVKIDKANNFRGELIFEYNNMEMSAFYSQFLWANNFYMHHQITQGYTNKGQWLGAGLGTGGNSQFLGFNVYYPKGNSMLYLYRYNVDNDYLLRYTTPNAPPNPYNLAFMQKTVLGVGIKSLYFFMNPFHMYVNLTYLHLFDYVLAGQTSDPSSGFHIELGAKINF